MQGCWELVIQNWNQVQGGARQNRTGEEKGRRGEAEEWREVERQFIFVVFDLKYNYAE